LINIRRDVKDAFYRYKMPRLVSKIEGRGNGIKTVLDNATEAGRALNRLPSYITKFFAFELGTLCIINDKDARYIVNGAHDAEKLQDILDSFIKKFVLCPACENPETDLLVNAKDGTVLRACKACGHRGGVDMAHRLVAFIEKNPPPTRRRVTNVAQVVKVDSTIVDGITQVDSFAASADAVQRRTEAKKAEKARRKLLSYHAKLDAFAEFLEQDLTVDNESVMDYIKEANLVCEDAIIVVVQVLLNGDSFSTLFKSRLPLLVELVRGDREQRFFLGSLERLVAKVNPKLLRQLPAILQIIYNADLVEESLILLWHQRVTNKFVRREVGEQIREAARPFVDWLMAEEEEESSNDEESN
jgi:translation initiation factor 5